jgi:hypothetical protein
MGQLGCRWQQPHPASGTREKEGDMTETTPLGLIMIAIVTVIVLAA